MSNPYGESNAITHWRFFSARSARPDHSDRKDKDKTADNCQSPLAAGIEAANLTVQRVNLENAQGIGIQTEGQTAMTGCLMEDVRITNVTLRSNGAHGVALWPYKGTSNCVYRRITIDQTVSAGIALDAERQATPMQKASTITCFRTSRSPTLAGRSAGS
jgi:hypothetical protein